MSDIVEELRSHAAFRPKALGYPDDDICLRAAAALTAERKRVAELERERDLALANADGVYARWVAERERVARLERINSDLVDAHNAMNLAGAELERQMAHCKTRADAAEAALAAEREKVATLESALGVALNNLQNVAEAVSAAIRYSKEAASAAQHDTGGEDE